MAMALIFGTSSPVALGHLVPEGTPGLLALRHALTYGRPPVWVNNTREPTSILVCRRGRGPLHNEICAAGDPVPALRWIRRHRPGLAISLLAPPQWYAPVASMVGKLPLTCREVQTWHDLRPRAGAAPLPQGPQTRLLGRDDAQAFHDIAPRWALGAWMSFDFLIHFGAAVGVPDRGGLAAAAWIYDACGTYDAIGVVTRRRYRRLGLGRAVASALIEHIQHARRKLPLWSTQARNTASVALARSLGFTRHTSEMLFEWPSTF
jgi:GNAT superfamily N-acetyltransferase